MKHEWFYWKQDPFRCCKKCGAVENRKITNRDDCPRKVEVKLRKTMEVPLTQGMVALVDKQDYKEVMKYKWYVDKKRKVSYASHTFLDPLTKTQKKVTMHRFIMDTPKGMHTDHINGNGLDNRRSNLRICTASQNRHNVGVISTNTSGYKGVVYHPQTKLKWLAQICFNGKNIYLGVYPTKELAYEAYCKACIKYHGEFSRLK